MSNFKELLDTNVDNIKAPPALPEGNYHGTILSYEFGDDNKNKTPYARFKVQLHSAGDDVNQSDLVDIDLSKRIFASDVYLQTRTGEDQRFRLVNFIKSLGIDVAGRQLIELVPETVGGNVMLYIEQYFNPNAAEGEPARNRVGRMTGVA
jgi:hypothetical protein